MYPHTGEAAIRLDTGIFLLIYLLAFTLKEIILWKDSNITELDVHTIKDEGSVHK